MMRGIALLALLFVVAGCGKSSSPDSGPSAAAPPAGPAFGKSDTSLRAAFRKLEARIGGKLGIAAINLESGWRTSYRGDETFPLASVGKLPMAIVLLRKVDSGACRLDSQVTLTAADHAPGHSLLFRAAMQSGGRTTVHALLEAMLIYSDNTACDYILKLIGGPKVVRAFMKKIGLPHINVAHSERDLILLWAGVDPASSNAAWTRAKVYACVNAAGDSGCKRAERALVNDPADAAPPKEMALLLQLVHSGELLSERSNDTLLAMMARAMTGRARIPALLPEGTPVAHKTGTIGSTTNDVGLVHLPAGGRPLAIAVFVKAARGRLKDREQIVAEATQLVYQRASAR